MSIRTKVVLLIVGWLVFDQVVKILVKTQMFYGETIPVFGQWFRLHFVENEGMAFGVSFGGVAGKIGLSLFRLAAVAGLSVFIHKMIKKGMPTGFILALGMITAGAAGNIIDSAFYGLIFNESGPSNPMIPGSGIAELFPKEGGYAPFLQGRVVDMLYFPVIKFNWPDWVPMVGGNRFEFFRPIFNLADTAITVGVGWILLFQRKALKALDQPTQTSEEQAQS